METSPGQFIEELSNKFANKETIPSPTEMLVALGELKKSIEDLEMENHQLVEGLADTRHLYTEIDNLHIRCGDKPICKKCQTEAIRHLEFDYWYCLKCGTCEIEWRECQHELSGVDCGNKDGKNWHKSIKFYDEKLDKTINYRPWICGRCGKVVFEREEEIEKEIWFEIKPVEFENGGCGFELQVSNYNKEDNSCPECGGADVHLEKCSQFNS